jgi:hypothetical protein
VRWNRSTRWKYRLPPRLRSSTEYSERASEGLSRSGRQNSRSWASPRSSGEPSTAYRTADIARRAHRHPPRSVTTCQHQGHVRRTSCRSATRRTSARHREHRRGISVRPNRWPHIHQERRSVFIANNAQQSCHNHPSAARLAEPVGRCQHHRDRAGNARPERQMRASRPGHRRLWNTWQLPGGA